MSAACGGWVLRQWKNIQVKFINVTTYHTSSSPGQLLSRQPHLAHPWACQGQQSSHTKVWPNLNSDELLPPKFLVLYWFWRDHLWATIITDPDLDYELFFRQGRIEYECSSTPIPLDTSSYQQDTTMVFLNNNMIMMTITTAPTWWQWFFKLYSRSASPWW